MANSFHLSNIGQIGGGIVRISDSVPLLLGLHLIPKRLAHLLIPILPLRLSTSFPFFLIEFKDIAQGPAGGVEIGKSIDDEVVADHLFSVFVGVEHIADIENQAAFIFK